MSNTAYNISVKPIHKLTDAMRAAIRAIRSGDPCGGIESAAARGYATAGEISRRQKVIRRLVDAGIVSVVPDTTTLVVRDERLAQLSRLERTWGHAVRPLNPRERAYVERDHGRIFESSPKPHATCALGKDCPHKAEFMTLYSYVTGRRGRVSCAERYACSEHAERFRRRHDIAPDARPAPDVGEERRQTMASILGAIDDFTKGGRDASRGSEGDGSGHGDGRGAS